MSFPKRALGALSYNEQKVQRGVAECIAASGYLGEPGAMNVYQKLRGLENRNALNSRATTKTLHVSLNFDPSENLSNETLLLIAAQYMERIGFGAQPYLVYRHYDAGHPHLHIVSTTIREDGRRLPTHNLGRHQSEKARKEIEGRFGLLRAEGRKKARGTLPAPGPPVPVSYGRAETKEGIAGVVHWIFQHYAFSSLSEYNAALALFNVRADGGEAGSSLHRLGGLVYRLLDEKGEKVGVPIKASSLPGGPTLQNLQWKFATGEHMKGAHKAALIEKIDRCFSAAPARLEHLVEDLKKRGVDTQPRRDREGRHQELLFVDRGTRCVFQGSDLGPAYSAEGVQDRLASAMLRSGDFTKEATRECQTAPVREPEIKVAIHCDPGVLPKATVKELLPASRLPAEPAPTLLPRKKRKKKRIPRT